MEEGALYSTYRYLGGILYQTIVPDREGYLNLADVLRDVECMKSTLVVCWLRIDPNLQRSSVRVP